MTKLIKGFYCYLLLLDYCGTTYGQTIDNVRIRPLNGSYIEILYDLSGSKPGDSVYIQVETRRTSLYVSAKYLTGDVGRNVTAGKNRRIVWNTVQNGYELRGKVRVRVYLAIVLVESALRPRPGWATDVLITFVRGVRNRTRTTKPYFLRSGYQTG